MSLILSEPDPAAPILLFDSGVGGLTVLAQLRKLLPQAPVIYVADNAGFPYGSKTESMIAARVHGLLGRLTERLKPRLVCIPCNTASTIALNTVRDVLEVPVVGTVPAIKPAASMTKTGTIGLLGTAATIRQKYIDKLEAEFARDKRLIRLAAPDLVTAAESKLRGDRVSPILVARAVEGLISQPGGREIDTVVLGCTHFPLLADELAAAFAVALAPAGGGALAEGLGGIATVVTPRVALVDGAEGIARRIVTLTDGQAFARAMPDYALFTKDAPKLDRLAPALAEHGLERMEIF